MNVVQLNFKLHFIFIIFDHLLIRDSFKFIFKLKFKGQIECYSSNQLYSMFIEIKKNICFTFENGLKKIVCLLFYC